MTIESRIKNIEKALGRKSVFVGKPIAYIIDCAKGETEEQAKERYELENGVKISDEDFVVVLGREG